MIQGFRRAAVWVAVVILGMISGGCGIGSDADSAASGGLTCLTVNYRENPIGIEDVPVFGWRMQEGTGRQTAYRILVAESPEQLDQQEYVGQRQDSVRYFGGSAVWRRCTGGGKAVYMESMCLGRGREPA